MKDFVEVIKSVKLQPVDQMISSLSQISRKDHQGDSPEIAVRREPLQLNQ